MCCCSEASTVGGREKATSEIMGSTVATNGNTTQEMRSNQKLYATVSINYNVPSRLYR
jgi:hypothetical protein